MILQNNQTDLVLVPAGQLKPLDTICGFQVRPGFFLDFGATVILVESTSRSSRIRQPPANFYCSTGKRKSPLPFFHFLIITASDSAIP